MKKYLLLLLLPLAIYSCKKDEITAEEQAKIDKEIILKYIKDSSLVVDSTSSGLYYAISDSGVGAAPYDSAFLTVYYKGYLTNGTVFDKNQTGQPATLFLHNTIAGWKEGIPKIKKNGRIKLLIPSALGYGTQEVPTLLTTIPASSVLIFDVELSNFQ